MYRRICLAALRIVLSRLVSKTLRLSRERIPSRRQSLPPIRAHILRHFWRVGTAPENPEVGFDDRPPHGFRLRHHCPKRRSIAGTTTVSPQRQMPLLSRQWAGQPYAPARPCARFVPRRNAHICDESQVRPSTKRNPCVPSARSARRDVGQQLADQSKGRRAPARGGFRASSGIFPILRNPRPAPINGRGVECRMSISRGMTVIRRRKRVTCDHRVRRRNSRRDRPVPRASAPAQYARTS